MDGLQEMALAGRLQALEIMIEEAITAMVDAGDAPMALARLIADRARAASSRLGRTGEAAFALAMDEQVNRMARNLLLRAAASGAAR